MANQLLAGVSHFVAVVGVAQLIVIGSLGALLLLEQLLAATKRVRANSIVQAFANALYAWARVRYPLVAKLGNIAQLEAAASAAAIEEPKSSSSGGAPPPAALLVFVAAAFLVAGCGNFDWRKFGVDEAQCLASPVKAALADASSDLVDSIDKEIAGGNGFDSQQWAADAKSLGVKYGFDVVACAGEHLVGDMMLAGPEQLCSLSHRRARPAHLPYLRKLLPRRK